MRTARPHEQQVRSRRGRRGARLCLATRPRSGSAASSSPCLLPPTPAEPQGIFNQRRDPKLLSPQSPFVAWASVVSHRPFLSGVTVLRGALENPLEPRWSPACLHRVAQLGFPVGIRVDHSSRQRGSPPCSCRGFRLAGRRSHLAISEATVTPAGGSSASAVRPQGTDGRGMGAWQVSRPAGAFTRPSSLQLSRGQGLAAAAGSLARGGEEAEVPGASTKCTPPHTHMMALTSCLREPVWHPDSRQTCFN